MTRPVLRVRPDEVTPRLDELVTELLTGAGAVFIEKGFGPTDVDEANRIILHHSSAEQPKVTHFHGAHEDEISLQRRVWNLLNKGDVFARMVQHPQVMELVGAFLGDGFIMGSVAANRILPGGPGQEPHIDYPYWDLYKRGSFPVGINSSFPLNCQATVLLHDFTERNGATAFVPGSQRELRYPDDDSLFSASMHRMTGRAGDVVVFNGMIWHCAQPNHSDHDRTALLIQYLAKFVKPMEDQVHGVRQEVVDRATPRLRQLMGLDYPYPQILDDAEAINAEGRQGRH
ncbi:MAG: phytanoyl-CoA dioxygenase family protein [Ilumatobacteraceae bacterium]